MSTRKTPTKVPFRFKYIEGQILEDGREVLDHYILNHEYLVLIVRALEGSSWSPEEGHYDPPSDRYDLYMMPLNRVKKNTDIIKDCSRESNFGCHVHPKNDVMVAKMEAERIYREQVQEELKKKDK